LGFPPFFKISFMNVAIPLNAVPAGDLSAKLGGLVVQPNGYILATPQLAAAVSQETGVNVTPANINQVVNAVAATPQVDSVPANLASITSGVNTSDVGSIDANGNITDYIGQAKTTVSNWFADMFGSAGGNLLEYGFFGALAVGVIYFGRKFFHSKTGLGSPYKF